MRAMLIALLVTCVATAADAGPKVEIIVAEKSPPLESRAADEVGALLKRLYQAEVTQLTTPSGSQPAIFIGNPATNPALVFAKADWPKLTDQGHIVKSTTHRDQPALIIGGGSPVATYWAACEYAHHLGVRTMLYGDLDPIAPPAFSLAGLDLKLEPELKIRGWKIGYHEPASFAGWSQADQVRFLGQLAKLKFNELVIRVSAGQPFIHFEAAGIRRLSATFWWQNVFPVDGDTAGRGAFAGAKFFENPDLAKATSDEERINASQALLQGVVKAARGLGMKVTFFIEPYDLPPEFDRGKVRADPELARACIQATARAYIRTFPEMDALMIGVQDRYPDIPNFFAEPEIWQRPDKSAVSRKANSHRADEQPLQWLKSVPDTQNITYRGWYHREDVEEGMMFHVENPARSIFDLELNRWRDQPLPQITNSLTLAAARGLSDHRWQGFVVTADDNFGCLDLGVYLLSRNSFGAGLSPERGSDLMLTPVCGAEVHTCVSKALALVEHTTMRMEARAAMLGRLGPRELWPYYAQGEPAPDWFGEVKSSYLNAMNEMYRANTRAREGSRSYTLYLARQFEFGFEYMNCLQAMRNAGVAKKAGDKEQQIAELEKAIDSINGACNALAAVARSNSDRGTIAVLNAQIYRPLVRELEMADKE